MASNPYVAKKYIIYREWRTIERDKRTHMKQVMDGIVAIEKNDEPEQCKYVGSYSCRTNDDICIGVARITPTEVLAGDTRVHIMHSDIHIHDLDYYPTKTTTCIPIQSGRSVRAGFPYKERKYSYASVNSELCHIGNHHISDKPKRTAWRAIHSCVRLFLWQRAFERTFVKHAASFTAPE